MTPTPAIPLDEEAVARAICEAFGMRPDEPMSRDTRDEQFDRPIWTGRSRDAAGAVLALVTPLIAAERARAEQAERERDEAREALLYAAERGVAPHACVHCGAWLTDRGYQHAQNCAVIEDHRSRSARTLQE